MPWKCIPPTERIMRSISVSPSGCWEWTHSLDRVGYGKIKALNRTLQAHRFSWMVFRGEIPDSLCVLHECDNRKCVNPDHLFLGTQKDNMDDCARKGRNADMKKLARESNSKVTEDQVREIRRLYFEGGLRQEDIGNQFGLSKGGVQAIASRRCWKDI